jgi:hypothetical protein
MARQLNRGEVRQLAASKGIPPEFALAIWGQESSGGKNTKTSATGARGAFQMEPPTFQQYNENPNGDINDPTDNAVAAMNYMHDLLNRYGGDYNLAGQAYYGGRPVGYLYKGIPKKDVRSTGVPGSPLISEYGASIASKANTIRAQLDAEGAPTQLASGSSSMVPTNYAPSKAANKPLQDLTQLPMYGGGQQQMPDTSGMPLPQMAYGANPTPLQMGMMAYNSPQQRMTDASGLPLPQMSGYSPSQIAMTPGGPQGPSDQVERMMAQLGIGPSQTTPTEPLPQYAGPTQGTPDLSQLASLAAGDAYRTPIPYPQFAQTGGTPTLEQIAATPPDTSSTQRSPTQVMLARMYGATDPVTGLPMDVAMGLRDSSGTGIEDANTHQYLQKLVDSTLNGMNFG